MPVPYKLNYFDIETGIDSTSTLIHSGDFTANKIIKIGGTSNDILLGDGTTASLSGKQNAITLTTTGSSGAATLIGSTLNIPNYGGGGTVTSVAALTLGTSGTDLSSTVANSTTTPVITLNVPTASATNRGALSSADWTTFNSKQVSGNYITSLTGEATASGPGAAAVTLTNSAVIAKVLTGLNVTGGTVVAADSILAAFGKVQNQINGLIGGSIFQGVWNANTNTPALVSSVGTNGHYYIVSVAGSTNLNGITDWNVGDWAIFAGTSWQKVDNTDAVISVNGYIGAVSLVTGDILEGAGSIPGRPSQLYFTDARARAAISLTTIGSSGVSTYNSTTGVLNIPNYTDAFVGTVTSVGLSSTTSGVTIASTPITTSGTITIDIATATASQSGLLSSTDWTTFNNKQGTITLTTTGTSGASTLVGSTLNIPNYSTDLSGYVPYTGATANVDLGSFDLTTDIINLNQLKAIGSGGLNIYSNSGTHIALLGGGGGAGTTFYGGIIGTSASFSSSGSSDTYGITHSSGAGIALNITKGGNGEGIYVNKTSGSGNAVTIIGTLNATTLVKSGGTSAQFLKADGTVDSTAYGTGSVTSVAALTLGTTGTDLSSTVANGTTTPVITLNVPDASATARGVVTTGTQEFTGLKTFSNNGITANFNRSVLGGAILGFQILGVDKSFLEWNVNDAGSGVGTAMNLRNNQGAIGLYDSTNTGLKISSGSGVFAGSSTATAFIPTSATIPTAGMYLSAANTLAFSTNSLNRVTISSAGNTAIGIAAATERLHLANSTNGFVGLRLEGTGSYAGSDWTLYASSNSAPSADDFLGFYNNSATDSATVGYKFTLDKMGVATFINLAGTGSRAVLADASGVLSAPVSDISVKQNIVPIGYGLNQIMKMNPVWFEFVDEYKNFGQGRQNGNIAQEIEEIIPEAVFTTPSTGKMGINYDQLHAVYIKAIQELKAEIDILKNK
jgi:hypothetical protein